MPIIALTTIFGLAASSLAEKPTAAEAAKPGSSTIVDIVLVDDGEFDILQAAVTRAGLVEALDGRRQFTVFAPTDQAFIEFLGAPNEATAITAIESLPDADLADLTDILLYHVTSGRRTSTSVIAAGSFRMLNGDRLTLDEILEAGIAPLDISASNGVIHVIGKVLESD